MTVLYFAAVRFIFFLAFAANLDDGIFKLLGGTLVDKFFAVEIPFHDSPPVWVYVSKDICGDSKFLHFYKGCLKRCVLLLILCAKVVLFSFHRLTAGTNFLRCHKFLF